MAQQTMGAFTEDKVDALSRSLKEPEWLRILPDRRPQAVPQAPPRAFAALHEVRGGLPVRPGAVLGRAPERGPRPPLSLRGPPDGQGDEHHPPGELQHYPRRPRRIARQERARGHDDPRGHLQEGGPDARPVRGQAGQVERGEVRGFQQRLLQHWDVHPRPSGGRGGLPSPEDAARQESWHERHRPVDHLRRGHLEDELIWRSSTPARPSRTTSSALCSR